ncbi:MAG: DUF4352 domain-containing protein [Brachybacterium tyrofermentans]|uniref:DUF4352 domain-containing protein n=1 Tax=Brachybacterium tyrofermentans TaxID=47848 RepID=UPI003FB972F7
MNTPFGIPSTRQRTSRRPLFVALGCSCALLAMLVLIGGGTGIYFLAQGPDDAPPTSTEEPTDDPTADPTEDPTDEPTADPTTEPSDDALVTLSVSGTGEGTTLDADGEKLTSQNGKFVGTTVTIENQGDETIGLDLDNFLFHGDDGSTYELRYGAFSTSGPQIAPGETATADVYVDVSEDTVLESVSYSDPIGTGGEAIELPLS